VVTGYRFSVARLLPFELDVVRHRDAVACLRMRPARAGKGFYAYRFDLRSRQGGTLVLHRPAPFVGAFFVLTQNCNKTLANYV
jgi:hypothetical protein